MQSVLRLVYGLVFSLPPLLPSTELSEEMANRWDPKCRSKCARAEATQLLAELVRVRPDYYLELLRLLTAGALSAPSGPEPADALAVLPHEMDCWPLDEQRGSTGFVGLRNLGATCYMNTSLQHLFMIPLARNAVLLQDPVRNANLFII